MIILPKNKYIIGISISALIGIAVVVVSAVWLNKIESIAMTEVVVAADKLEPGLKLTTQKLMLKAWPKDSIPIGAVLRGMYCPSVLSFVQSNLLLELPFLRLRS